MATFDLSPYGVQGGELEHRRLMAQLLSKQGAEPLQTNRTAGGFVVPISPFEGLAKVLQSHLGAYGQRRAGEELKALGERKQAEIGSDYSTLAKALQGTPAQPEQWMSEGMDERLQPATEAKQGMVDFAALKTPEVQNMAMALMAKRLEPFNLREGERRFNGENRVIAENPKPQQGFTLSPGQTRMGPDGKPIAALPESFTMSPGQVRVSGGQPVASLPSKTPADDLKAALDAAGVDLDGPEGKALFKALATKQATHQPPASQTVTVNTEKQLYGNIAEVVGKDIATASQNAKAALSTLNTVGQIREALESGKVIAGPATTARMYLGQIGQVIGIAGKDATEQLTKTRSAIQGLAQLELDAAQQMKGQGQITEAERSIIRRAASGDIDSMTVPELRTLTDTLDKTARYKIRANAANVAKIKANPQSASLAQFMDVPEPPPYSRGGASVLDQADAILKGKP